MCKLFLDISWNHINMILKDSFGNVLYNFNHHGKQNRDLDELVDDMMQNVISKRKVYSIGIVYKGNSILLQKVIKAIKSHGISIHSIKSTTNILHS